MSRITRAANAARTSGWRGALRWRPQAVDGVRHPRLGAVPTTLKALLALLLLVIVMAGAVGHVQRIQRTAESTIEILLIDSFSAPGLGAEGGFNVQYRYEVDGVAYTYVAFRNWSLETVRSAKVCYDPEDPTNQSLTRLTEACG